jgi:hypothetical protein
MSVMTPGPALADHPAHLPDIRLYSHSPLLYWWPVWAMGFLMALWTAIDNHQAAFVPAGTVVEDNLVIAPEGQHLEQPLVHVAQSPIPGALFVVTLLLVMIFSNASLRGPWALVAATSLAAVILLFNWLRWWDPLWQWVRVWHIHINLGGYLAVAMPLFIVWVVVCFFLDHRTYIVFTSGQMRIRDRLGVAEKVFDAWTVSFEKKPYNWFHRLVGFGAGDMEIRAGGADRQTYELTNVVRVAKWLGVIEERLKTREVEE